MEGMYHLKPSDLPLDFNNNEPKTFNKRLQTLSSEIHRHPNADELLNIMSQQLEDDTPVAEQELLPLCS